MLTRTSLLSALLAAPVLASTAVFLSDSAGQATLKSIPPDAEEVVAACQPPNNGAGPLWCYGAPLIVRQGGTLFASVMETGEGIPPLCNTRWRLYRRTADGWSKVCQADGFREREPCPLVISRPNELLLSINPSVEPPGTKYGRCDPQLLQFDMRHPEAPSHTLRPKWSGNPRFTDHSYRGIAADPSRGDVLLLNIGDEAGNQYWTLRDGSGQFTASGIIRFPIRACYPQVAIRGGAAHVMAIGDIVEPRDEWRSYKLEKTGSSWDYVFRRLFYTWSPDVRRQGFATPIEVENVEDTGGHITNLDLYVDQKGTAHLLYLKANTTKVLRDRFFPGVKIKTSLELVQVSSGKITQRTSLLSASEDAAEIPTYARFHCTPDGSLYVVYAANVRQPDGGSVLQNRLVRVIPGGPRQEYLLGLKEPFTTFFTAAIRGGSQPSWVLDLFGTAGDPTVLRYARVPLRHR
ncbi:MAG: hypothetical protein ACUVTZ_10785 [Armatimonadota bacterium]